MDCGYNLHPRALQYDHVRDIKLFNISDGWRYPLSKRMEEIAKCEVVCANCHAIRTSERNQHNWRLTARAALPGEDNQVGRL